MKFALWYVKNEYGDILKGLLTVISTQGHLVSMLESGGQGDRIFWLARFMQY